MRPGVSPSSLGRLYLGYMLRRFNSSLVGSRDCGLVSRRQWSSQSRFQSYLGLSLFGHTSASPCRTKFSGMLRRSWPKFLSRFGQAHLELALGRMSLAQSAQPHLGLGFLGVLTPQLTKSVLLSRRRRGLASLLSETEARSAFWGIKGCTMPCDGLRRSLMAELPSPVLFPSFGRRHDSPHLRPD